MSKTFISIFFLLFSIISFSCRSDESVPAKPVQLVIQSYENNNNLYIAISYENAPEWHTYWKNPGDAGLAIKNQFVINKKEIKLLEEEWPAPRRFIENGTQWAFGYLGSYTLFYKLDKNLLNKVAGKTIQLDSTWLVCKHICVPGRKQLSFKLANKKVTNHENDLLNPISEIELTSRFMNLPQQSIIPEYLEFKLTKSQKDKSLVLTYEVKKTTDVGFLKNANLIYSYPSAPFDFGHENLIIKETSLGGIVEINWDGEYSTPPEALPADGIFKKPHVIKFLFNDPIQRKMLVIEKKFLGFDSNTLTKVPSLAPTNPSTFQTSDKENQQSVKLGSVLFYYLILAFLGGVILNIMPCVLPIISLKLFGLIKYQTESRAKIIRHNLFYTLGILSTFLVLALIIVLLKSFGTQVGWGFQLQSPNFVALMIIVLFIFSLNLFGLFEFSTPGGRSLGNVKLSQGFAGDYFSGVLATILSTPCSAPFLGTALTFAFSSSGIFIILIFLSIGLGLASPFIVTAFIPSLISFLPKPGNWMNMVKKILGLTLILTLLWLFDVYIALVDGSAHFIKLSTTLVFIFAGFGVLKKEKWIGFTSLLIALLFFINLSSTTIIAGKDEQSALIRDKRASGLNWEPWSVQAMQELKENRQIAFIDFTAKWCFTCKVNERLVLDTAEFKKFVSENNLKLLIGDWTKRDEVIASFLRDNGLVGVPAYFIQKKDGSLINLGETISIGKIKKNL